MKNLDDIADFVAAQKLELAARNLQHLLKMQQEQASLENIVGSLQQTVIDAHANNPMDICDSMAVQMRIFDAVFQKYVFESDGSRFVDDKLGFALKAQNQMLRTAQTWKRLKAETEIKYKLVTYMAPEKKQTERTDGLDQH